MHFTGKTATGKVDWLEVHGHKGSVQRQRESYTSEQGRPGGILQPRRGGRALCAPCLPWTQEQLGRPEAQTPVPHLGDHSGFSSLLPHATTCPRKRLREAASPSDPNLAPSALRSLWPPVFTGGGVFLSPMTRVSVLGPRCAPAPGTLCSLLHPCESSLNQANAFLCPEASLPNVYNQPKTQLRVKNRVTPSGPSMFPAPRIISSPTMTTTPRFNTC